MKRNGYQGSNYSLLTVTAKSDRPTAKEKGA